MATILIQLERAEKRDDDLSAVVNFDGGIRDFYAGQVHGNTTSGFEGAVRVHTEYMKNV